MLVVVALGGNALAKRGEPLDIESQRINIRTAARTVAEIAEQHDIVVTHGNGPQVGLLAMQAEAHGGAPLDVLGAESDGMIGYLIEQELRLLLPGREICTLLTQVVVDPDDPAFAKPTKPVGPVFERRYGLELARERGWRMVCEGPGLRRVVPSPVPRRVIELNAIRLLLGHEVIVICAGGGGIPVAVGEDGGLRGIEAVIDKDLTAALLAEALGASVLLLLTDVDAVYLDWGTEEARAIRKAPSEALRRMSFAPGSMGPKVLAARRFVENTGGKAAIGRLHRGSAILSGEAGTQITSAADKLSFWDQPPPIAGDRVHGGRDF